MAFVGVWLLDIPLSCRSRIVYTYVGSGNPSSYTYLERLQCYHRKISPIVPVALESTCSIDDKVIIKILLKIRLLFHLIKRNHTLMAQPQCIYTLCYLWGSLAREYEACEGKGKREEEYSLSRVEHSPWRLCSWMPVFWFKALDSLLFDSWGSIRFQIV